MRRADDQSEADVTGRGREKCWSGRYRRSGGNETHGRAEREPAVLLVQMKAHIACCCFLAGRREPEVPLIIR